MVMIMAKLNKKSISFGNYGNTTNVSSRGVRTRIHLSNDTSIPLLLSWPAVVFLASFILPVLACIWALDPTTGVHDAFAMGWYVGPVEWSAQYGETFSFIVKVTLPILFMLVISSFRIVLWSIAIAVVLLIAKENDVDITMSENALNALVVFVYVASCRFPFVQFVKDTYASYKANKTKAEV